jgi:hypothetical protein
MVIYNGFTHWTWWFSSSLCKRLPEGYLGTAGILLSMVKLWNSCSLSLKSVGKMLWKLPAIYPHVIAATLWRSWNTPTDLAKTHGSSISPKWDNMLWGHILHHFAHCYFDWWLTVTGSVKHYRHSYPVFTSCFHCKLLAELNCKILGVRTILNSSVVVPPAPPQSLKCHKHKRARRLPASTVRHHFPPKDQRFSSLST